MTTIIDVAQLAGTSIATVSRVMNGDTAVRPRTRRAVEEAITQLEYRPNAAARSLRLARSQTLGVVVNDLANPVFFDVVHGIEGVARAHGYALFLCDGSGDPAVENLHLERLFERRVDGLIYYALGQTLPALNLFLAAKAPVVAMGPRAGRTGPPGVILDERPATALALHRLVSLGHRHIAVVDRDTPPGRFGYRAEPIRRTLAEAGVPLDPALHLKVEGGDACREATRAALLRQPRPTAIIAITHALTPHILQAIGEAGLQIPRDISFLAFGDSAWAVTHQPPLTVVRIDYEAWGRETAELLLHRIQSPRKKVAAVRREAVLVERGSFGVAQT